MGPDGAGAVRIKRGGRRVVLAIAVLAALLLAALLGSVSGGAAAGVRVRNGLIFFDKTSVAGIWSIRPDGSGLKRVTVNGFEPWVSADGTEVAFVTQRLGLALMNADGSNRRVVPTPLNIVTPKGKQIHKIVLVEDPSFSPDGKEVIFDDTAGGLWAVNTDGSNLRNLLFFHDSEGGFVTRPVFSPDGTKILFTGSGLSSNSPRFNALFLMNSDGTHVRAVPHTAYGDVGSFSRDGKSIVFALNFHIWRIASDGSHRQKLTAPKYPLLDRFPAFSPDGTKIVFFRHPNGNFSGPHGLFVVNADGSHVHKLPHASSGEYSAWQPLL